MPSIIKMIAKELNVSTASVSRAINDQPGVGDELRSRILAKAKELNYAPSAAARGLVTAQTFTLGFFVAEKPGLSAQSDPFYGEILQGVEQAIAQSQYHLTIATLTKDIIAKPAQFRFVREQRIDGMILAGPDIPSSFIMAMRDAEIPTVLVDNNLEYSVMHNIICDDEGGAYLAVQHLLEQGHQHIGILSGPANWSSNQYRVKGYQRALTEAGLPMPIVYTDRTTVESGTEAYHQISADYSQLSAICAVNDAMAIGAIHAIQQTGKSIPEDVSVVGFDDIEWARLNNPPLTTLSVPKYQMGTEAATRLMALLKDPEQSPTTLSLSVRFVERGSSSPPPSLDKA